MKTSAAALFLLLGLASCASAPDKKSEAKPARGNRSPAAEGEVVELPIPEDLRPHVRRAEQIGRQLYILDKVAAIGTDVLMEHMPDFPTKGRVRGYLPMREGDDDGRPKDSYLVTFYTGDDPPRLAYGIRVAPGTKPVFEAYNPPKPAPPGFVTLARARDAAVAALPRVSQPYNPVVMPGSANDEKGILVYLLAGTKKPNLAVFGMHFRVLIPERGRAPSYVMPLSKSVLELPTKGEQGEKLAALMVTHIVTDWPLETHVFTSLLWRLPVYVGTKRGIWRVDGDKIALIGQQPSK